MVGCLSHDAMTMPRQSSIRDPMPCGGWLDVHTCPRGAPPNQSTQGGAFSHSHAYLGRLPLLTLGRLLIHLCNTARLPCVHVQEGHARRDPMPMACSCPTPLWWPDVCAYHGHLPQRGTTQGRGEPLVMHTLDACPCCPLIHLCHMARPRVAVQEGHALVQQIQGLHVLAGSSHAQHVVPAQI